MLQHWGVKACAATGGYSAVWRAEAGTPNSDKQTATLPMQPSRRRFMRNLSVTLAATWVGDADPRPERPRPVVHRTPARARLQERTAKELWLSPRVPRPLASSPARRGSPPG